MSDEELREAERTFHAAPSLETARAWESKLARILPSVDRLPYRLIVDFRVGRGLCQFAFGCFEKALAIVDADYGGYDIYVHDEMPWISPLLSGLIHIEQPLTFTPFTLPRYKDRPSYRAPYRFFACEQHIAALQEHLNPSRRHPLDGPVPIDGPPLVPDRGYLLKATFNYSRELPGYREMLDRLAR